METLNIKWIPINKNPPKCNQIVLGLLNLGNIYSITPVYVVKFCNKRRYGLACVLASDFDKYDALKSFPIDDKIIGWAPISILKKTI